MLLIIDGGILGGIIGEVLSGLSFGSIMPDLVRHYEIFNIHNVTLNLYVMVLTLGIHFSPNLLSNIGILVALFIYRRI